MKRFLLILMFLILMAGECLAVGTVTITSTNITVQREVIRKILTLSWACAAGEATIPNTTITAATYGIEGWYMYSGETNPGGTAPTDNYDITILDADSYDIAGTLLTNRDATATEMVNFGSSAHGYPIVRGNLTFTLGSNAVNAATGTLILIFIP